MPEYPSDTLELTALPFWQWPEDTETTAVETGLLFDVVGQQHEAKDTVFRKSIFHNHSLQLHHEQAVERVDSAEPAWVFISLLMLTGLVCIYFRRRKIRVVELVKSLVNRRAMDRIVRDCNLNRSLTMLPMGLLLTTAVAFPIHRMALAQTGRWGFLLVAAALGLLYILRNGLFRLLGNIFENKAAVNLYITNNYLYHLGEAAVVCVMLYHFCYLPGAREAMLYLMGGFLALAFVSRFVRGVKVFLTLSNACGFYLFYYLCIVEIIPLLVVLKWFIAQ